MSSFPHAPNLLIPSPSSRSSDRSSPLRVVQLRDGPAVLRQRGGVLLHAKHPRRQRADLPSRAGDVRRRHHRDRRSRGVRRRQHRRWGWLRRRLRHRGRLLVRWSTVDVHTHVWQRTCRCGAPASSPSSPPATRSPQQHTPTSLLLTRRSTSRSATTTRPTALAAGWSTGRTAPRRRLATAARPPAPLRQRLNRARPRSVIGPRRSASKARR